MIYRLHTPALAEKQFNNDSYSDSPIIDLFRILKIDFETPDLIQDCGSMFFLKVNITKIKLVNFPIFFSITVLLKTKDNYGRNIINFIGSQPFIFLPHFQKSKTISIPCFTNKNFTNNLYRLNLQDKCLLDIYKGSIGVRIERTPRWLFDSILGILGKYNLFQKSSEYLMNYLWVKSYNSPFITSQSIDRTFLEIALDNDFLFNLRFRTLFRLFYFFNILRSNLISMNRLIVWEDVNLIRPFVCSDDIFISDSDVYIDEKTDKKGNFTVQLKIVNNLDFKVNVRGDVDILETPFINTFMPSIDKKFYNAGFFRNEIQGNDFIVERINCSFPKDQIFLNKSYIIKVECAPYLSIGDSNKFGFYFFDLRWKTFIEPKYVVNDAVTNSIRKMWYNAPIFYGEPGAIDIFPYYYGEIEYNGTTPGDKFQNAIKTLSTEVKSWIYLYFIFTLLIIGFALIGYWIVKRKRYNYPF